MSLKMKRKTIYKIIHEKQKQKQKTKQNTKKKKRVYLSSMIISMFFCIETLYISLIQDKTDAL